MPLPHNPLPALFDSDGRPVNLPCIDHSQQLVDLANQSTEIMDSVRKIERAVLGEIETGQEGLVAKAKSNTARIDRIERVGVSVAGGGAVIVVLWEIMTKIVFR